MMYDTTSTAAPIKTREELYRDILDAVAAIESMKIPRPNTLFGMRVVVMKPQPKIQVRASFEWITDECRERMNRYLVSRFGFEPQSNDVYQHVPSNTLYVPHHIYDQLRKVGEL